MITRKEIEAALGEFWPPSRITARCSICGEVLWDSETAGLRNGSPVESSVPSVAGIIYLNIQDHKSKTRRHDAFDIRAAGQNPAAKGIDVRVAVNGEDI